MKLAITCLYLLLTCLPLRPTEPTASDANQHDMFLLRDQHLPKSIFASAQVACAFNEMEECRKRLAEIIGAEPRSGEAVKAHHLLAYAAIREGHYQTSLNELDALLAIDPNDSDANGTRPLIEAFSHFPDQVIESVGPARIAVRAQDGKLPVTINGKPAAYFLDTGANLSTVSESEAERLGLEIRTLTSDADTRDVSGKKVNFRVALARKFAIRGIQLKNVAFLVASNDQQPFINMEPGERGIIGLPVLYALGSVKWNRDGRIQIDRGTRVLDTRLSNLFLDDLLLITQARFEQNRIPCIVDTGAETTDLWQGFADAASALIHRSGTRESHTVSGMGGEQDFAAMSLPEVTLDVGGQPATLKPAHVLLEAGRTEKKWLCGNLGNDLLKQSSSLSIDFRTMILSRGSRRVDTKSH